MHDSMPYGRIQGQRQGHKPLKVWIPSIFKTYLLRHLQWELANDHWIKTIAQYLNLIGPDFWYFSLFLCRVTLNLEQNVSCKNLIYFERQNCYVGYGWWVMLDGMSDSIQRSRIENLHSREVDRQSPTGLIFIFCVFSTHLSYYALPLG